MFGEAENVNRFWFFNFKEPKTRKTAITHSRTGKRRICDIKSDLPYIIVTNKHIIPISYTCNVVAHKQSCHWCSWGDSAMRSSIWPHKKPTMTIEKRETWDPHCENISGHDIKFLLMISCIRHCPQKSMYRTFSNIDSWSSEEAIESVCNIDSWSSEEAIESVCIHKNNTKDLIILWDFSCSVYILCDEGIRVVVVIDRAWYNSCYVTSHVE